MARLTADEVFGFLAEAKHMARIVTVDSDGAPRILPLWFILDGDRICFNPDPQGRTWQNILRETRLALAVDETKQPYRQVTVQGKLEIVHEAGRAVAWRPLYRAMVSRYLSYDETNDFLARHDDPAGPLCAVDLRGLGTRVSTWKLDP